MNPFELTDNTIIYRSKGETVRVAAWGPDAVRVQAARGRPIRDDLPGALPAAEPSDPVEGEITPEQGATLANGLIRARFNDKGRLTFERSDTDETLLTEPLENRGLMDTYPPRYYHATGPGTQRLRVEFAASDERIWGMGQQRHGRDDHKGTHIELMHTNGEFVVPFYVSSGGYGFLWNNPSVGDVSFAENRTVWRAQQSEQIDYWVVAGKSYRDILCSYVRATGLPPAPSDRMAGYWQCKLRYKTQDELLEVAREFKRKNLPIDVIVIDFFHWTEMGDFRFDPECWPDPEGMVEELREMGIEAMVSVWPTVSSCSENLARVEDEQLMIRHRQGEHTQRYMVRKVADEHAETTTRMRDHLYVLDFTKPDARAFTWEKVKQNYLDKGIPHFWLDASEPSLKHYDFDHLEFHAGPGASVALLYPNAEVEAFVSGMREEGREDGLLLTRCLWAGGQRYGAAVWSGDIPSTFDELQRQIVLSLHASMSGLHLWHADIGGFSPAGDLQGELFRELLVRWFQWSVFLPVCRMHGVRRQNEPWSFGEQVEEILTKWLGIRYELKPYILDQLRQTSRTGLPPVRPLWVDHQDDPACLDRWDQYRFGDRLMVAPVYEFGARSRTVYLPGGHTWFDAWTGRRLEGGQVMQVEAPLDRIPVYLCDHQSPDLFSV